MDTFIIFGAAALLFGIVLALAAWLYLEARKLAKEREALAAQRVELEAEAKTAALALQEKAGALAAVQGHLDQVTQERDKLKTDFENFITFLVEAGVLREQPPELGGPDDLRGFVVISPPEEAPRLPELPDLEAELVEAALRHAAQRSGPRADRPFSRSYMVKQGPLTRGQLDRLCTALVTEGYLEAPTSEKAAYSLTDKGRDLLDAIKAGAL